MAGIVESALGRAISDIGGDVIKRADKDEDRAWQQRLMQLEEEKQLRLDEIKRARDTADIVPRAEATANANLKTAPINAQASVAGKVAEVDATVNSGLIAKQAGLKQEEFTANKPVRDAGRDEAITGEIDTQTRLAQDPNYLSAKSKIATASEGSSTKAAAAASQFELSQKKLLADLRANLSKTENPEARKGLESQIRDLSGASTKSYSDMVSAGNAFRMMANTLRQELRDNPPLAEADVADMQKKIADYETQASSILGATVDKRLGGSAAPAPAGSTRKIGDTQQIQSGPNQGKTARWDGKGWVLTNSRSSGTVDGR